MAQPIPTGTQSTGPRPPGGESLSDADIAQLTAATGRVAPADFIQSSLAEILQRSMVSPSAAKKVLEDFLRDTGAADDPLDRMWYSQALLAHHRLAQLQVQAAKAEGPEHIKVLNACATRLFGTIGKYMLSIQEYRFREPKRKPRKRPR